MLLWLRPACCGFLWKINSSLYCKGCSLSEESSPTWMLGSFLRSIAKCHLLWRCPLIATLLRPRNSLLSRSHFVCENQNQNWNQLGLFSSSKLQRFLQTKSNIPLFWFFATVSQLWSAWFSLSHAFPPLHSCHCVPHAPSRFHAGHQ